MATVVTAAAMFVGTNIDDAVVLTVLNVTSHSTGIPRRWQIWAGQYLGVGLIVAVSGLAALGLCAVPVEWIGLLGLVPLSLGVGMLVRARRRCDRTPPPVGTGLWSVVGLTVANGGDNVSVYTPAFRIMGPADALLTVLVFAILTAAWCSAGMVLTSHRRLVEIQRRYSRWVIPFVLIALGLYIIDRSGLVFGQLPL
ncbi:cadmium resistance transporter [Nocardia sp. NPDC101769]|uniref:cadmium resistance transporter n=1 Tax=Nocardia sp. NPDC101769 TaxID=3364333 RepID=UPI00380CEE4D